jgi:hypothetical protein
MEVAQLAGKSALSQFEITFLYPGALHAQPNLLSWSADNLTESKDQL